MLKKYAIFMDTILCLIFILVGLVLSSSLPNLSSGAFILAFLIGGYKSAKEGLEDLLKECHLNVDVLMVLAAIGAGLIGYWMEGALLIFIFSLSSVLEELAMEKSRTAIAKLLSLTPSTARLIGDDGDIVTVPTSELEVGDRIQIRKGEAVALDGRLLSQSGLFDQSMVTGEPIATEKNQGEDLIGGTINQGATVEMEVTAKQGETVFDNIVRLVENAQKNQSRTASIIEKLEDTYVKVVILLVPAFIAFTYFGLGWDLMTAFYRGMILLTVASPCALVASSSSANLSAISRAAQNGVMIKGGDIADRLTDMKVLVTDKTGTLTKGQPSLTSSYFEGEADLIRALIKTVESGSTHPIAKAFVSAYENLPNLTLDACQDLTGQGFQVNYQGQIWRIGKKSFVLENLEEPLTESVQMALERLEEDGKILILVSCNQVFQAYFALEDQIKPEAYDFVRDLRDLGIQVVMVTGDQEKTARYVANRLGIEQVYANCMPDDKVAIAKELEEQYGMVGMVGDGINDAPALATAGVSFAVGEGTDIAIESADVVIMEDLRQIPYALSLSKKMRRIVMTNLIFSLAVILSLICANVFQVVSLPLGVIGHEGSTILVILNGLRLLAFSRPQKSLVSPKAVHLPCPSTCCLLENRV